MVCLLCLEFCYGCGFNSVGVSILLCFVVVEVGLCSMFGVVYLFLLSAVSGELFCFGFMEWFRSCAVGWGVFVACVSWVLVLLVWLVI